MKLEITRYNFQMVDGDPKIVISMVKQMEDDGKYIKFAKMKDILPELCKHPVTFKHLEFENEIPSTVDFDNIPF